MLDNRCDGDRCGGVGGTKGPCPGEHSAEDGKATGKLKQWGKVLASLPGKVKGAVVNKAKAVYNGLVEKYGPAHAKVIMTAAIVTLPIPGSTIAMLGVCALASLSNKIIGKKSARDNPHPRQPDGTYDYSPDNKAKAKHATSYGTVTANLPPRVKGQVSATAAKLYQALQDQHGTKQANLIVGSAIIFATQPMVLPEVLANCCLSQIALAL